MPLTTLSPSARGAGVGSSTSSKFRANPIAIVAGVATLLIGLELRHTTGNLAFAVAGAIAFVVIVLSLQMAYPWESAVVLRAGKFRRLAGPGLFFLLPVVDSVALWIDQRVQTSTFTAEETLTKDTVPVDVDAVLFWVVWDAKKAALEVTSYQQAIQWAAQTALRDIIGTTSLADLLSSRQMVDEALQKAIDARSTPWGITVNSVEIRDIKIPDNLQDAMSRQAQAQRESQARVILGDAEKQIAQSFVDAAKQYEGNPMALHLRAMNMLYEGLKEKGAMIVVPSTAVETMGLGTIGGLASLSGAAPSAE
ncbi:MAG: slipin family protein [Candidatus Eremiobacteraeota bacterium]|nr:slipin family protein [Candidatus Eremiobacteraeota bacterium]